tara:strand:+ start:3159 stop:3824 length:666 start_codon:yes stop_codon:yes gene_type:complete
MNELIQIIDVLNKEDLKLIDEYTDSIEYTNCRVLDDEGGYRNGEGRTSEGHDLNEDNSITRLLHLNMNKGLDRYKQKISKINPIFSYFPVPGGFDTDCYRDPIQILKYSKGQEYKFHHDTGRSKNEPEYFRHISIILYLKTADIGGGTSFIHKTFKPSPGQALIFPSNWCYPHSGDPVEEGIKKVAVTWYYSNLRPPVKKEEEPLSFLGTIHNHDNKLPNR